MIRRRIKVTSITVTRRDLDKNKFRSGLSGASWQRVKIMNIFKKARVATADTMAPRKLTLAEIQAVSGGLNPQPLPPSHGPESLKRA